MPRTSSPAPRGAGFECLVPEHTHIPQPAQPVPARICRARLVVLHPFVRPDAAGAATKRLKLAGICLVIERDPITPKECHPRPLSGAACCSASRRWNAENGAHARRGSRLAPAARARAGHEGDLTKKSPSSTATRNFDKIWRIPSRCRGHPRSSSAATADTFTAFEFGDGWMRSCAPTKSHRAYSESRAPEKAGRSQDAPVSSFRAPKKPG